MMTKISDLHSFIKDMLKQKGMRIETFLEKASFSKSTFYRILRGYQKPSEDFLNEVISILRLSDVDQKTLKYYCGLVLVNDDTAYTREEIVRSFYKPQEVKPNRIEMIYMDGDKYVRSFDEILKTVIACSKEPEFECDISVLNCCNEDIIKPLSDFIFLLSQQKTPYMVEHLLDFSSAYSKENIVTLFQIIPMLQFSCYRLLYTTTNDIEKDKLFNNFIKLKFSFRESNRTIEKNLYFSFLNDRLSMCLATENQEVMEFFERSFDYILQDYTVAVNNQKTVEVLGDSILEMELNYDMYLFKPNPCYNRVPMEVFFSVAGRVKTDELHYFIDSFSQNEVSQEQTVTKVKELLEFMSARNKASYAHKQVDIFTRAGMESFVKEKRLSERLTGFPLFIDSEIKMILEYIIERDKNQDDSYCFYILNKEYNNEELLISAMRNYGLILENENPTYYKYELPYCVFEHEGLSEAFCDFADNYVPMLAMDKQESYNFLYQLIDEFCN
jgi:transcriptional regulator with XRE-family HTH domain